MEPALSRLAARLSAFAGLDPPAWVLEARARERAAEHGRDLGGYLALLDGDPRELAALAEAVRVGETRFFRHAAHIDALRRRVIPERAAQLSTGKPLRAWSAGCASGEEAWTLAILCAEAGAPFEVLATDLSEPALAVARAGRYPEAALAEVPEAVRKRWFTVEGGLVTVAPALRDRVRFERRNLAEAPYPRGLDVILCRNVLIYFDGARRAEVVARLAESLSPGGYLFLGYSESLRGREDLFEAIRDENGVIYRRRSADAVPVSVAAAVSARTIARSPDRDPVRDPDLPPLRRSPAAIVHLTGSYDDDHASRLARELKPILDGAAHAIDLDGAVFLGDEAARILQRVGEASHARIALHAERAATRRWIARHQLERRFAVDGELDDG